MKDILRIVKNTNTRKSLSNKAVLNAVQCNLVYVNSTEDGGEGVIPPQTFRKPAKSDNIL